MAFEAVSFYDMALANTTTMAIDIPQGSASSHLPNLSMHMHDVYDGYIPILKLVLFFYMPLSLPAVALTLKYRGRINAIKYRSIFPLHYFHYVTYYATLVVLITQVFLDSHTIRLPLPALKLLYSCLLFVAIPVGWMMSRHVRPYGVGAVMNLFVLTLFYTYDHSEIVASTEYPSTSRLAKSLALILAQPFTRLVSVLLIAAGEDFNRAASLGLVWGTSITISLLYGQVGTIVCAVAYVSQMILAIAYKTVSTIWLQRPQAGTEAQKYGSGLWASILQSIGRATGVKFSQKRV